MVKSRILGPINKEDMNLDITNLTQLSEVLKMIKMCLIGLRLVQLQ